MQSEDYPKLRECPFCGGEVKLMAIAGEPYPPQYEVNLDEVNEQSDDICFVHCPACGANWHIERRIDSFPLDTIRAWNRRAQPANEPMTLDELREMLERLEMECQQASDGHEDYTNGYRWGHRNGQIELLRQILNTGEGTCESDRHKPEGSENDG